MHTKTQVTGQPLARLILWLRGEVLPLWAKHGLDHNTGVAYERLLSDARPDFSSARRAQTQAKLIYVLARAECVGWGGTYQAPIKLLTAEVSRRFTAASRSDGYVHSLSENLVPLDSHYYTRDHAFFVLSSIATYSAFGIYGEMRRAHNIIDWLNLRYPDADCGWKERSGNPRNHTSATLAAMTEAFLTLYDFSQKPHWLELASRCVAILRRFFYGESSKVIFTEINAALRVSRPEVVLEDQLQWAWLLTRYEARGGEEGKGMAAELYQSALQRCFDQNGLNAAVGSDSSGYEFTSTSEITLCARVIKANLMHAVCHEEADFLPAMEAAERVLTQYKQSEPAGCFTVDGASGGSVDELFELFQAALQVRSVPAIISKSSSLATAKS